MHAADPQLTASQVLRTFHHDELYLFLGAAFTTLGLMSAALSFLQRKFDAMLFWLALFAILYGQRLWLQSGLLTLMVPPSLFFDSLKASSNYLVPIPAFFYFEASGFLGRYGRKIATALSIPFLGLFVGTILFGPKPAFNLINHLVVILTLIALIVQSLRRKNFDSDFIIVRRGIAAFVAFALFDNIAQALGHSVYIEPIGFAFFLATGEEFGPLRLSALLKDGASLNPEAAADHIVSSLQTWSKSQNDDLTVLICDYASVPAI